MVAMLSGFSETLGSRPGGAAATKTIYLFESPVIAVVDDDGGAQFLFWLPVSVRNVQTI
ncbi:hypothetical protein EV132_101684 [Rhizobium sullae]|uniref:Uncharacterized protein n=1 Tax=Rhizobium sullae TaxID=50338 RepID=A0A4R3QI67_RHISU|nr:hypothetical protein EV132_101684 [Rhizobium sullae]